MENIVLIDAKFDKKNVMSVTYKFHGNSVENFQQLNIIWIEITVRKNCIGTIRQKFN